MLISQVGKSVSGIVAILMFASCSGDHGPTDPQTGILQVSTHTTGGDPDTGYDVLVGTEQSRLLATEGFTRYQLAPGSQSVSLENVAPNCEVKGENPRSVNVNAGDTVDVVFEIECMLTGITVRTVTTGADQPAQIRVTLGGYGQGQLHATDSLTFSRMLPSTYEVTLSLPADNCSVSPAMNVSVEVMNRTVSIVDFRIVCVTAVRPQTIAFVSDDVTAPVGRIEVISPDGTRYQSLRAGVSPSWSPDGRQLVVSTTSCKYLYYYSTYCGGGITVFDAATLAYSSLPEGNFGEAPSWSVDDRIAFTLREGERSRLYVVSFGKPREQISLPGVIDIIDPAWSPEGKRIAFGCKIEVAAFDLCIVNADGTGLRRLTHSTAGISKPAWSPDGEEIAFTQSPGGMGAKVMVIQPDGNGLTFLTEGSDPSYSPDGTSIVFAGSYGLFIMGANGSSVTRLTTGPHRQPAWRR